MVLLIRFNNSVHRKFATQNTELVCGFSLTRKTDRTYCIFPLVRDPMHPMLSAFPLFRFLQKKYQAHQTYESA